MPYCCTPHWQGANSPENAYCCHMTGSLNVDRTDRCPDLTGCHQVTLAGRTRCLSLASRCTTCSQCSSSTATSSVTHSVSFLSSWCAGTWAWVAATMTTCPCDGWCARAWRCLSSSSTLPSVLCCRTSATTARLRQATISTLQHILSHINKTTSNTSTSLFLKRIYYCHRPMVWSSSIFKNDSLTVNANTS